VDAVGGGRGPACLAGGEGWGRGRGGAAWRCETEMPSNTEGKGSELREGLRLKGQCRSVLEKISISNIKNIQTISIEGTQLQCQIPAANVYIQTGL